ncbi:MAG: hypothetical protein WAV93_04405 [Bacteroidales bacterium]
MDDSLSFRNALWHKGITAAMTIAGSLLFFSTQNIAAQTAVAGNSGPICSNGTVMLNETGGDAVSWEWSSSGAAVFNDRTLQNPSATGVINGEIFTVLITDAGGNNAVATTVVTVFNSTPARPGLISGNATPCVNATGVVYSISPVATATSYLWEVPVGVEIISGQGTISITVNFGPATLIASNIRVSSTNACGTSTPPRNLGLTVTQLPVAAGPITGSSAFTPGTTAVPYSVGTITNATSYAWSYIGTGVTITGNGSSNVTLDFASDATAGQLSVGGINTCGAGTTSSLELISASKRLTLSSVLLEGLYSGSGTMRQAWNSTGPQYAAGVADHITVELHDAGNYLTVVWSLPDVPLSITGTAEINIPAVHSGSYYITIRHRNSIATTTALPVSFAGSIISYSFGSASTAYYGNLKLSRDGVYLIFGADVNQDGIVDTGDMNWVDNGSAAILRGYNAADATGDGIVDTSDMNLVDNNSAAIVRVRRPN